MLFIGHCDNFFPFAKRFVLGHGQIWLTRLLEQLRGALKLSDIDFVIVVNSQEKFVNNLEWINKFGKVNKYQIEDYGRVQSIRVFYNQSFEVEFGITEKIWTEIPVDSGTFRVISDGCNIIIDKTNKMHKLINEVNKSIRNNMEFM